MPRVEHRRANKDYPQSGIKKGERYYTWKFKFGGRRRQKTKPLPEQLTQSEYLQEWYPLQRQIQSFDGSADDLGTIIEAATNLGQDQQDKLDNMPDSLQDGATGELLRERNEECEELVSTLEDLKERLQEAEDADDADEDGPGADETSGDDDDGDERNRIIDEIHDAAG